MLTRALPRATQPRGPPRTGASGAAEIPLATGPTLEPFPRRSPGLPGWPLLRLVGVTATLCGRPGGEGHWRRAPASSSEGRDADSSRDRKDAGTPTPQFPPWGIDEVLREPGPQ